MPDTSLRLAQALDRLDGGEAPDAVLVSADTEIRALVNLASAIRRVPAPVPREALRRRLNARWSTVSVDPSANGHANGNGAHAYNGANGHAVGATDDGLVIAWTARQPSRADRASRRRLFWRDATMRLAAACAACALIAGGTVVVSANSLPGDTLYPAKLVAEQAQLVVTLDINDRARLQVAIAERRVVELESVVATADASLVASAVERASTELIAAAAILSRVNRDTVASDSLAPSLSRETASVGQKLERMASSDSITTAGIKPAVVELERAAAAMSTAAREGSRAIPSATALAAAAQFAPTATTVAPSSTALSMSEQTIRAQNPTATAVVIAIAPPVPTATEARPSPTVPSLPPTPAPPAPTAIPKSHVEILLGNLDARVPTLVSAMVGGQRESIEPQILLYYRELDLLAAALGDVSGGDRDRILAAISGRLSAHSQSFAATVNAAPASARPALRNALVEIAQRQRLVGASVAVPDAPTEAPAISPTVATSPTIALTPRSTPIGDASATRVPTTSPVGATATPGTVATPAATAVPSGPTPTSVATPAAATATPQPSGATNTPSAQPTAVPTQIATPMSVATPIVIATPPPTVAPTATPGAAPVLATPMSLPSPTPIGSPAPPTAAPNATPAR
ncbi:MAG: hypothetical protein EPO26_09930 [Chloroflexota bacterium]|nr:MAG: hypothetical protein EPO26_09930 [Chloroflexota bacterium]